MPLMAYRDGGGYLSVRYVPAVGGRRGRPGRPGWIGRPGRRSGSLRGGSAPQQHSPTQLHVPRACDDGGLREPTARDHGRYSCFFLSLSHLFPLTLLYDFYTLAQTLKSVSSRRRQQRKQHHQGDESDESESDADQLTSSRTESSNQLDAGKLKHSQ